MAYWEQVSDDDGGLCWSVRDLRRRQIPPKRFLVVWWPWRDRIQTDPLHCWAWELLLVLLDILNLLWLWFAKRLLALSNKFTFRWYACRNYGIQSMIHLCPFQLFQLSHTPGTRRPRLPWSIPYLSQQSNHETSASARINPSSSFKYFYRCCNAIQVSSTD